MCAKVGTIVIANNELASGGGNYELPYRSHQMQVKYEH